jgi:hypothetical protein
MPPSPEATRVSDPSSPATPVEIDRSRRSALTTSAYSMMSKPSSIHPSEAASRVRRAAGVPSKTQPNRLGAGVT